MWGEHVDFVMLENVYRAGETGPHLLLPRGKFTAWYRLGSGFRSRTPAWICPSIMVPRQLAGQARTGYYLLMFLEAYANGGRWGYNWWPGVDEQSRYAATVPERLKDYIEFITRNRELFEQAGTGNEVAILYLDGCISERPREGHQKYLALAQALAEAGYQYDVHYVGDGRFNSRLLSLGRLTRYRALLIPEAGKITSQEADVLARYMTETGGRVISYGDAGTAPGHSEDEEPLLRFWRDYRDVDRQRILASVEILKDTRLTCSDPLVSVIRSAKDGPGCEQVLHLLNYNYDAATDEVRSVRGLQVRLPWPADRGATCTLLRPGGDERLSCTLDNGHLVVQVPELDVYGLLVVRPDSSHVSAHMPVDAVVASAA